MSGAPSRHGLLLSGAFVALLAVPVLVAVLAPGDAISQSEKRRLADFPPLPRSVAMANAFPGGFNAWFNDHFGLRVPLGQLHALIRVKLLATSPKNGVAVGRDGWLYYGGAPMQAYRGAIPVPPQALSNLQYFLESKRDWLAERGIRYLFTIAPDKQTVYPEHVPLEPVGPTPADFLVAHLAAHSDLEVLDQRTVLQAARPGPDPLYMKTDSHWNALGAFVAYRAIMERVRQWFPLTPLEQDQIGLQRKPSHGGNLADQINLAPFLRDEEITVERNSGPCNQRTPVPVESPQPYPVRQAPFATHCEEATPLRVLVLRDSFANDLAPFLSRQFADVTYIWQGSVGHPLWETPGLMRQILARQQVDLVIEQLPERKLMMPVGPDPEFMAATARRQFSLAAPAPPVPLRAYPVQQAAVSPADDGLVLRPTGAAPVVALPLGPDRPGRWPVVRLTLTSPAATRLVVLYQTTEDQTFSAKRRLMVPVDAGANAVYFEIPSAQATDSVLLGLGQGEWTFRLHQVEIRAGRQDPAVPTPTRRLVASAAGQG